MLAVLVIAPAADRRALYIAGAAARKDGLRRIGALVPAEVFFDIRSRRDDLEGGAGLIGVAHERVAGEGVELRRIPARDVVEVVRGKVDHREHGKIGRVEHDAPRRLCPVLFEGARHHLFRERLDAHVEGERHVEPVLCGNVGSARTLDLHADKVGLVQDLPLRARKIAVVLLFDAREPRAVRRGKAEHLAAKSAVRIDAAVVPRVIDALKVCPLHGGDRLLFRAAQKDDLRTRTVGKLGKERLIGERQKGGKRPCRLFRILHGVGAGVEGVCRRIAREKEAVRIEDIAAFGGNGQLARPLIDGARNEFALPDELDIEEPAQKKAKKKGYRRDRGK